ncbi:replication initiator protein RctB domain-containing protein [Thalassotalea sp. PLHSN55]|uniref:replication initiator protein RctB domain-containing protein n=1 Tax=Thalassotalea sp. PLHSN55 TaxID=3435888 RepID=UPI003F834D03
MLVIDPIKHFGTNLDRKSGHLFFIDLKKNLTDFLSALPNESKLTPSQIKFIKAIDLAINNDNQVTNIEKVESYLSTARVTLNKTVSQLVKYKIFKAIDFSITTNDSIGRSKCYQLADKKDWLEILTSLKPNLAKPKKLTKEDIVKNILIPNQLATNVIENDISRGMYPRGVPQFEKFLPNRHYSKKTFIKEATIQGRKVLIELRTSDSSLMFDEDLKTVFILMTLFINQQANSLNYYIQKKIAPLNKQYVEIRHIMRALKKNSAGSYYDSFVKSIMRIKRTTFDLHGLEAIFIDAENDEKLFATTDFSFFQHCWPISSEGAVVDVDINDNEFIKINPKGFLITWNDVLFKKMLSDNYFFVIPLSVLSSHTIIFLLYMYLRNHFSRKDKQNKTLKLSMEELHSKLNSSTNIYNFRRDLLTAIKAWLKHKKETTDLSSVNAYKFDIEGFSTVITFNDGTIDSISFRVVMEKMLNFLDIETIDGKALSGNTAAPTSLNPMFQYLPMLSNFKETRGNEFPQDFNARLLLPRALKNVSFQKTSRERIIISLTASQWYINFYTSDREILDISEHIFIGENDDSIQQGVFTHIEAKRDRLSPLTSEGFSIDRNKFILLKEIFLKQLGLYVSTTELYDFLYQKEMYIKLLARDWDGDEIAPLLNTILDSYKKEHLSQQDLFTTMP